MYDIDTYTHTNIHTLCGTYLHTYTHPYRQNYMSGRSFSVFVWIVLQVHMCLFACTLCRCIVYLRLYQCAVRATNTGWRRVIGCFIFIFHLSQKSPETSGTLARRDLQLKASYSSLSPCRYIHTHIHTVTRIYTRPYRQDYMSVHTCVCVYESWYMYTCVSFYAYCIRVLCACVSVYTCIVYGTSVSMRRCMI